MRLKVLTLNVWALPMGLAQDAEARMQAIARRLMDLDADVVGFQEVWTESALRSLVEAGREAGYLDVWHRPAGMGSSGLLVLSRLPIASRRFIPFGVEGFPERIDHGDYHGGKGFALLELSTPSGPIALLDTHLHARYAPDAASDPYRAMRLAQVVQIAATTMTLAPPLVALGDFNLREDEIEYRTLLGLTRWVDAAAELDQRQTTITPDNAYRDTSSDDPGERIDYVFTRDGLTTAIAPRSVKRVFDESWPLAGRAVDYSDHAGVEAVLEVGGPPSRTRPTDPAARDEAQRVLREGLLASRRRESLQLAGASGLALASGGALVAARRVTRRRFLLGATALLGCTAAGGLTWMALGPSSDQTAGFEAALESLSHLGQRPHA